MAKTRIRLTMACLLMTSMITAIAGCGSKSAETAAASATPATSAPTATQAPAETPAAKKDPIELTIATFNEWAKADGLNKVIAQYEQATGNKVKLDVYPDDQFLNVLKTKMSTNDAPDLFQANLGDGYVPYTSLEPLSGPWADKMQASVKAIASKDGKVYEAYAFPLGYLDVIYNKDVFQKAGVKVPLTNYKQLTDAMEAIKKTGVTPIFMPGKEGWTYEMIPALGGVYALYKDADSAQKLVGNKVKPADVPSLVDLAKRSLDLKKYFNKDDMSAKIPDGFDGLLQGKYAMTFLGDWMYDDFAKANPDKIASLGMMPVTLGDDYISAISNFTGRAFGVPANSKHKDAAKEFINFVLQPENYPTLVQPFKGSSPYDGYQGEMNPWQKDMDDIIKANHIPITDSYLKAAVGTFQLSDTWKPWQDMFAGKAIQKSYDDWYKDYQRINQAKKTPGW